jgi:hypothetical protein
MLDPEAICVLEFSQSQEQFSIRTLGESMRANLEAFVTARASDQVIVAVAENRSDAERLRQLLDCRRNRSKPFSRGDVIRMKEVALGWGLRLD